MHRRHWGPCLVGGLGIASRNASSSNSMCSDFSSTLIQSIRQNQIMSLLGPRCHTHVAVFQVGVASWLFLSVSVSCLVFAVDVSCKKHCWGFSGLSVKPSFAFLPLWQVQYHRNERVFLTIHQVYLVINPMSNSFWPFFSPVVWWVFSYFLKYFQPLPSWFVKWS